MCSDLKHVAAGPLLSHARAGKNRHQKQKYTEYLSDRCEQLAPHTLTGGERNESFTPITNNDVIKWIK